VSLQFPRPKVVVSKCLGFARCRYNGETISDDFTRRLEPAVDFLPVCPEVELGLGVPRESLRLVDGEGGPRLVQPKTDRDVTRAMAEFAREFLGGLGRVDGFLLKGRSPSCGPVDVKIYAGTQPGSSSRRGAGAFAAQVAELHPAAAVEHEGRVKNFALREHFLTQLYCRARFGRVLAVGDMAALVGFHAAHKLIFMAYSQKGLKGMGRIAANPGRLPVGQVLAAYQAELDQALAKSARRGGHINVLEHAMGYFKRQLGAAEKRHFLGLMEAYREDRAPLAAMIALVQGWIARWGQDYLAGQVYFAPFPPELVDLGDSGKGRDL